MVHGFQQTMFDDTGGYRACHVQRGGQGSHQRTPRGRCAGGVLARVARGRVVHAVTEQIGDLQQVDLLGILPCGATVYVILVGF